MLCPFLSLLGLLWPRWIRTPLPAWSFRGKRATGIRGTFALETLFSVAVCAFCTPTLVVLLGGVATVVSPLLGAVLLLAFALGRSVPIALEAWAVGWLECLKPLAKFSRAFETVGGIALIAAGLYLLLDPGVSRLNAMKKRVSTLGDDVLAAFERACKEGDLQVAEHLLRALEAMEGRAEGEKRVEQAYLKAAHTLGHKPYH